MSVTNRAKIEAYIGASSSGKGVSIKRRLDELKPRRLLIWDPRNEYGKSGPGYDSLPALIGAFKHAKGGPVRARYVPGANMDLGEAFGIVCKLAFQAGDLVFLAEELSDVTKPSWAPPAWRQCLTQGRHQALHIIGAAQRPTLIDKTFLANCTLVRCLTLGYAEDRKTMARELDVGQAAIDALYVTETDTLTVMAYLERERRSKELTAGHMQFKAGKFSEKRTPHAGAT
ncbi:hypothetical protein LNV08_22015 [Paucibacter sp. TC2R-5]|uniref:hypothetical protein n=1 Tax=Paucibacter sp. TC2R-5 TaxID=2893555 RepID=UPI0021E426DA|nr:hypothetical protein [Paucibacter sp. TC2R-5]MCV2361650.1 hypothetical protein [Paucibacter sp. TC2R-5]